MVKTPLGGLVSADAMGGSQRQTYVDWDGVETTESVKRERIPPVEEASESADHSEGRSDRGRPSAQTGAFAAEVTAQAIVNAVQQATSLAGVPALCDL